MAKQSAVSELFDRWERVWHEGQYDLIPSCVGPTYIRHDEKGDRTVTREAYAAEIAKARQERPNTRFVVYDHSFEGDRPCFRFQSGKASLAPVSYQCHVSCDELREMVNKN
jgi:hypothetical protein